VIDGIAEWDAAYVLGALSRDDRHVYQIYLTENPARAAALTELAGLPGILNVLSRDEAVALIEKAGTDTAEVWALDLMPSLASAAERQRQRSRRSMLAAGVAAAAAVAIGAGAMGATVFPRSHRADGVVPQSMQPLRSGITAALAVTEKRWGTRLDWTCDYVEDWAKAAPGYDIVVTTVEGAEAAVGTWSPAGEHAGGLAASTSIPTARIHTVDIRVSGTHEPLAVTTMR
jgi:hypothetical protein